MDRPRTRRLHTLALAAIVALAAFSLPQHHASAGPIVAHTFPHSVDPMGQGAMTPVLLEDGAGHYGVQGIPAFDQLDNKIVLNPVILASPQATAAFIADWEAGAFVFVPIPTVTGGAAINLWPTNGNPQSATILLGNLK